jgi:hypothetical protein
MQIPKSYRHQSVGKMWVIDFFVLEQLDPGLLVGPCLTSSSPKLCTQAKYCPSVAS